MSLAVLVTGAFDRIGAPEVRLLEYAVSLGSVHVALWSDDGVAAAAGAPPHFPLAERRYVLENLRFVERVFEVPGPPAAGLVPWPGIGPPEVWLDRERDGAHESTCVATGVTYRTVPPDVLGVPPSGAGADGPYPGAVIVTGCFDWLHSGHVRFFREASVYGQLHVVVGSDANVRHLKGDGHPMFPQSVRRYMVGAVRAVHRAWIATGWDWLDARPEVERIRPEVYLVNKDGDRPEKRAYCDSQGIRYVVLERTPQPGLPRRSSTDLRGF